MEGDGTFVTTTGYGQAGNIEELDDETLASGSVRVIQTKHSLLYTLYRLSTSGNYPSIPEFKWTLTSPPTKKD